MKQNSSVQIELFDLADITQLKEDMSTLRQELMSNLYRQDEERAKMSRRIYNMEKLLISSNSMFMQQYAELKGDNERKVKTLRDDLQQVDDQMKAFQGEFSDTMGDVKSDIVAQLKEAVFGIDSLKDSMANRPAEVNSDVQNEIAAQLKGATTGIDHLKECISKLSADVTMLCERDLLAQRDLPHRPRSFTQDLNRLTKRDPPPEARRASNASNKSEEEEPIFPRPIGPVVKVMHRLFDK